MSRSFQGFKKPAALSVMAALVLTSAACGSSGGNTGGSDTASSSAPAATAAPAATVAATKAPEKIVEITVWDKPRADNSKKALHEKMFAEFDKRYPNIKVTHEETTKGKEREQFMTAVAGGKQPDASLVSYPDMELYVSQGITADITALWNSSKEKDNFIPSTLNAATIGGKIYGIPNEMYVTGLMYNKKLFKDAGLDPLKAPTTWDEFAEYGKKLTIPEKSQVGYVILGMDWADWFFEYYVWQAGGDLTEKNPDGTVKLTFTSDAAVKALQYYKELKWKHKITQKNVVQSYEDNQKDFYTGHAAMQIFGSNGFNSMVSKGMSMNDIGFAPLPAGPSGKSPHQVGGNYWVINPKASKEEQEAAFTYAMFRASKEFIEADYQFNKDNGVIGNLLTVRKDIDVTKYVAGLPADVITGVQKASADTHLEYFLKSRLTSYIVKPIQKILLDEKADPLTELKAAQELAQKEVADKYNAEIKK